MHPGIFLHFDLRHAQLLRALLSQTASPNSYQALWISRIDAALDEERIKNERRRTR